MKDRISLWISRILKDKDTRNVASNIIATVGIKGFTLILALLTIPAYLRFFSDNVQLGVWFAIAAVLDWFLVFDLGIGNGLRNNLTIAIANKDIKKQHELVSSAYSASLALALIVFTAFLIGRGLINFNSLLNIGENEVSSEILLSSVTIVVLGVVFQLFLKNVTSVLYALQLSMINNLLNAISSILIYVGLLVLAQFRVSDKLISISIVYAIAINAPLFTASLVLFAGRLRHIMPSLSRVNSESVNQVVKLGGVFFLVQILYMVIVGTNEYLILLISKPEDVVEYKIYARLFQLVSTLFTLSLAPLWSAVTKGFAERRIEWVKQMYRYMLYAAAAVFAVGLLLVVAFPHILRMWLGDDSLVFNMSYALWFLAQGTITVFAVVFSTIANGAARLKTQTISYTAGVLLKLTLSFLLYSLMGDSWIGIVAATFFALVPYCVVEPFVIRSYFRRQLDMESNI